MSQNTEHDEDDESTVGNPTVDRPATDLDDTHDEATDEEEPRSRRGSEAARYRRQLREAQAAHEEVTGQVGKLREQLRAQQMQTAATLAAEHLHSAADLFAFGGNLDDVLADDGTVDPDKVEDAVKNLLKERSYLGKQQGFGGTSSRPRERLYPGATPAGELPATAGWSDVFGRSRN